MKEKSLQEWYLHINRMYSDRNLYRSVESMCCHLIEVCQSLNAAGTRRRNRTIDPETFLPRSIAWWMALCGKAGVRNIEDMVWAKFPRACPYCELPQHEKSKCKSSLTGKDVVEWRNLKAMGTTKMRPRTLGLWQEMFNDIYPRHKNVSIEYDFLRLSEELGELCEAIRSLVVAPQYFVSEAPDVFAWLMGVANQFDADHSRQIGFELERNMSVLYSERCRMCDFGICKCPPIHPDTLGRIAEEASIEIDLSGRAFGLQQTLHWFSESKEEIDKIRVARRHDES